MIFELICERKGAVEVWCPQAEVRSLGKGVDALTAWPLWKTGPETRGGVWMAARHGRILSRVMASSGFT